MLKNYVHEVGSEWIKSLLSSEPRPTIYTSQLTIVEAHCAFARRLREGSISPELHAKSLSAFDFDTQYYYEISDVNTTIVATACTFAAKHPLRAYDAVHLSTVYLLSQHRRKEKLELPVFLSADNRLLQFAEAEGIETDNPNLHP